MKEMEELARRANDPAEIWKGSSSANRDLEAMERRDLASQPLTDEECRLVMAYLVLDEDERGSREQIALDRRNSRLAQAILLRWDVSGGVVVCDRTFLDALEDSMSQQELAEYKALRESARKEVAREMRGALRRLTSPSRTRRARR